jgi:hypothetical protein
MEHLTQHAKTRMQQRGIPQSALECLLDYGRIQHDHRGAAIVFLDKAARRRLAREQGRARKNKAIPSLAEGGGGLGWGHESRHRWAQLEKHLDAYAVIATDGTVTTVGHRYKRIPRP